MIIKRNNQHKEQDKSTQASHVISDQSNQAIKEGNSKPDNESASKERPKV